MERGDDGGVTEMNVQLYSLTTICVYCVRIHTETKGNKCYCHSLTLFLSISINTRHQTRISFMMEYFLTLSIFPQVTGCFVSWFNS